MMLHEQINTKNNSLHFNESQDEALYANYAALARCLGGVEFNNNIIYPTIAQCCSAYGLYEDDSKVKITNGTSATPGTYTNRELIAVDIKTSKVAAFKNGKELYETIGLPVSNINAAIKNQSLYANKYLINFKGSDVNKMIEDYAKTKGRKNKYRAYNIYTQEEKIFDYTKEVAKHIGITPGGVSYILKVKKCTTTGWKVERINEEYDA